MHEKKVNKEVQEKYKIERKIVEDPELAKHIRKIERKSKKLRKAKISKNLEVEIMNLELKYKMQRALTIKQLQQRGEIPIGRITGEKRMQAEIQNKLK